MEAEIAIAGPRAVEKNSKVIDTCSSMVKDAVEKMEEALKLAGTDPSNEALQVAYETTCVVRLRMLQIWQAPSLEAIPEQRPLPSKPGKSGSSSDPTAQPATPRQVLQHLYRRRVRAQMKRRAQVTPTNLRLHRRLGQ